MLRVLFIHGLESSPRGTKARLLARTFDARTPAMDTSDFEGCVALQSRTIEQFAPDLVIGSSFGGAVAVALLQRGLWCGPTLLLAQAAVKWQLPVELPTPAPVWLVHGIRDDIVDPADSQKLAAAASDAERVRLFEVDDDHRLTNTVASGRLVELIRELGQMIPAQRHA